MADLIYREEPHKIMGACFELYRIMGRGFLETIYQECPEFELADRGIPFASQYKLPILDKGQTLLQFYKADFVCYDKIIVEVKAVSRLVNERWAQAIHYLRATGIRLAILVNFCVSSELEHARLII